MPLSGEAKRIHNRRYRREQRLHAVQTANKGEKKILVSLRIEESIVGRVQRMVAEAIATGRYRWRTAGAAYRGLILNGFDHPMFEGDSLMEEMRPYIDLLKKLDTQTHRRQEANAIVARAKNEIHELLGIKEERAAAQWYHTTMDALKRLPPDVWSDWAISEMNKLVDQYPALGQTASGVRFGTTGRRRRS